MAAVEKSRHSCGPWRLFPDVCVEEEGEIGESLFLYTAQRDAGNDVLGKEEIDHDDRHDGHHDHHVDLAHVKVHVIRAAQGSDQDRHRHLVLGLDDQGGDEVVVPRPHKAEDGLHRDGGLHDGQHDPVEGAELARAVDARGLHQGQRQRGLQVAVHEVKDRGGRDGRDDEGPQGVVQAHVGDQPQKAHGGDLGGHDQDGHDEGEGELFQPEIVGIQPIGRQRRKVSAQRRRGRGHDQAVDNALEHGEAAVVGHVFQVFKEVVARQPGKTLLQVGVGPGGVDDQDVKEEQAQKRQDRQHDIGKDRLAHFDASVFHTSAPPFFFAPWAGLTAVSSLPLVIR